MIPKFLLFAPRFPHVEKFFCEVWFSSILKMEGEGQAGKCVIFDKLKQTLSGILNHI